MKSFKKFLTIGLSFALLMCVCMLNGTTVQAKQKVLKQVIEFDPVMQQPTGYLELNINYPVDQLQLRLVGEEVAFASISADGTMSFAIGERFNYFMIPVNVVPNAPSVYISQYVFGDQYTDILVQANKSFIYQDDDWTFDAAGNPVQIQYTDENGVPRCTINCKYDAEGRITEYSSVYSSAQEYHNTTKVFAYDAAGRLANVAVSYNDRNGNDTYVGVAQQRCIYDAEGFITDYVYEDGNSVYSYQFIYE